LCGTEAAPGDGTPDSNELQNILDEGRWGDFDTLVSWLKHLQGRKILLYFGQSSGFDMDSPEHYNPEFAARVLGDANLLLIQVKEPVFQSSEESEWMEKLVGASNGFAIEANDVGDAVDQIVRLVSHYYAFSYLSDVESDSRFHEINLEIVGQSVRPAFRRGYFDTRLQYSHLRARTFLTALLDPEDFKGLPLILKADSSQLPELAIDLTMPFRSIRLEFFGESAADPEFRYFQRLQFFFAVYDHEGQVIGYSESESGLRLTDEDLMKIRGANAKVQEIISLRSDSQPASVRVVVVAGQNQQIATQRISLSPRKPLIP
jgi:hypothetical protein